MSKKVVIVSSSPRKDGNSETLMKCFEKGAKEAGHEVETFYLRGRKVEFCIGCFTCLEQERCIIDDDTIEIVSKMYDADVIVLATPVYYFSISGQLKTLFDRTTPMFEKDYNFTDVYALATAAESDDWTFDGAEKAIQGWVDCFERAKLCGSVYVSGVNDVGEIDGNPALEKAYEMGKAV